MALSQFHPAVARWFSDTLGEPTAAQRLGWDAIRRGRHTLIAAPTGSGKTLAAFLTALDDLFQEGLRAPLPDQVRLVYVSPLKALSADIHKNLAEPRRGIRRVAEEMGLEAPRITAAVRTGDTPQSERAAMLRTPPHILVTTPESLYLLLTAERSREMLRTVRTVIVDEIHALIGTKRGAHLALTLERLQQVAAAPLIRLGLSATQKPIDDVARYLVGTSGVDREGRADCAIVDEGHRRAMDLAVEMPRSLLDAVMSHEVWEDYYDRLTTLIGQHRTTLIFVNTRRMAERTAKHLSDRLGDDAVTAHHGSLSKEKRLDAESRLKAGQLKALVATASLELGIDIGAVDLVCQIGSPHRIATLLQRVGRSGHTIAGTPKGRLFPISRDDLIECAALLRCARRGELDAIVSQDAPLDVLAQQMIAESACDDYVEDDLYALAARAWPYRELKREAFDAVLKMTAEGFSTRRGRRAALVHRDEVQARVRGRRGTRMLALTSGGAIPEIADYRVVLEPEDTFIGTLNEDFAIESNAGDVFQLGNSSWRILQVVSGTVRVADAKGAPPTIPFWLGEAPARSDELSRAVSELRADFDRVEIESSSASAEWFAAETGISQEAALQATDYLTEGRRALGALPTQDTIILERFFDESGGMQLVLHAPFGSRVNKAWGLALRKRFCRQFNFELQAAATEDALLLSLGPQHSFPLADVFRYLHPASARDVLVQAFLDAPVFQTRWRWNTTISLAVPRNRMGRKVPPQIQRMQADDLMAAVFPDAAACLENIPGDRQIPDHPLVDQTVRDCLQEAMDFDGLTTVLERIHGGEITCLSRDTPEPSVLAHEILTARPYAFLDDAPLEERRTQAVHARRAGEPAGRDDLGALDPEAIARVREEVALDPRDAEELHDALLTVGVLTHDEAAAIERECRESLASPHASVQAADASQTLAPGRGPGKFDQLVAAGRATRVVIDHASSGNVRGGGARDEVDADAGAHADARADADDRARGHAGQWASAEGARAHARVRAAQPAGVELWVAAERLPEVLAVHPAAAMHPPIAAPASRASRAWTREEALIELMRGALSITGPATARSLAARLAIDSDSALAALHALEVEGIAMRGAFTSPHAARDARDGEWCDRRLLARIHRYTLHRLRAEIEAVSPADFMRFLFVWQHVDPSARLTGPDGLREIISGLDGFELPASAWERSVLPARLDRYDPSMLDVLCLTGDVGWARLTVPACPAPPDEARPLRARAMRDRAKGEYTANVGGDHEDVRERSASPASLGPRAITRMTGGTPIALFLREHAAAWSALRGSGEREAREVERLLGATARRVLDVLRARGASFLRELTAACQVEAPELYRAIGELVCAGLISSDGFAGVRATVRAFRESANGAGGSNGSNRSNGSSRSDRATRIDLAGRWSIFDDADRSPDAQEAALTQQAWALLRRYGVVFRRLLTRETNAAPWRDLTRVYRRLEARGEIRGGRFVSGMSGEQFALADAVERLREVRRSPADDRLVVISAADPLNLAGVITTGDRIRALGSTRIAWHRGVPIAAMEGDYMRPLADIPTSLAGEVASALAGRRVPPVLRGFIGRAG